MDYRVWALGGASAWRQTSFARGNLRTRRAQIKHGAGQMFGRVHGALFAQNLLRPRDAHVVNELMRKCAESGPAARARKRRSARRCACRRAGSGKDPGATARSAGSRWREQRVDIGVAFEDRAKAVFHHHGDAQIGAGALQNFERGRGEHAVAQRAQPQDGYATRRAASWSSMLGALLFDFRLVDQHHRDIVPHRVHAVALDALQPAVVGLQLKVALHRGHTRISSRSLLNAIFDLSVYQDYRAWISGVRQGSGSD